MKFPKYTSYPSTTPQGFRTVRKRITHVGGGGDVELDAAALTQAVSFGGLAAGHRVMYWRSKVAALASGGGIVTLAAALQEGANIPYAFPTGGYDYVAGNGATDDIAKGAPGLGDAIDGGTPTLEITFTGSVNLDTITQFDVTIDLVLFDPALAGD